MNDNFSDLDLHNLTQGRLPDLTGWDEQGKRYKTFDYTGAPQAWIVPDGVTEVTIECWGASGGGNNATNNPDIGAPGGYVRGTYTVTPSETLSIYVGGKGTNGVFPNGGWNGGGNARTNSETDASERSGGGGGATDVRQSGTALTNRIIVAGGGGGAGQNPTMNPKMVGGGLVGGSGNVNNGTQSTGGTGSGGTDFSGVAGSLGQGGNAGLHSPSGNSAGGGGGGYYGGGGGGGMGSFGNGSSNGGGGSGYVGSGTNTYIAATGNSGIDGRFGHGRCRITWTPIS